MVRTRYRAGAVMTVFFSLLSTAFLAVMFIMIESVRFRGVRAHIQEITDMGNYSLFGEFERKLLTDFELFAVDGAYGTGDFSADRVADRLLGFASLNTRPTAEGLSVFCFDPWKVEVNDSRITAFTLLSDEGGEPLYQEAVAFMRKTAVMNVTGKLLDWYQDAQEAQEKQEAYRKEKNSADRELEELEKQEAEKKNQMAGQEQQEGAGEASVNGTPEDPVREGSLFRNPLPALRRLARKDILSITCGDSHISENSVSRRELSSGRRLKKGSLAVKRHYGGLTDNLIFREYLLDRLACYADTGESDRTNQEKKLQYEVEYLLGGKTSDRDNLKTVVNSLLLVREGYNYLYCVSDGEMNAGAGTAAAILIGWTGIPALTAIMKHALLVGWAYGESLLDVRNIMTGGRVPLMKSAGMWVLTLDRLADINELLDENGSHGQEGLSYREYLRILLNMQGISGQKKRAVDLVELRVTSGSGLSGFKADHCLVAVRDELTFGAAPLFSKVTGVFMGLTGSGLIETAKGGFSYLS